MTVKTEPYHLADSAVIALPEGSTAGALARTEPPTPKSASRKVGEWIMNNGAPIGASMTAVAGVTAMGMYGPRGLILASAAVLSAAVAGVAGAHVLTARTNRPGS